MTETTRRTLLGATLIAAPLAALPSPSRAGRYGRCRCSAPGRPAAAPTRCCASSPPSSRRISASPSTW
ncbi:hypothetical protein ACFQU2_12815 [Siccirubricoccus deserti]